jgi:hypothetical protein
MFFTDQYYLELRMDLKKSWRMFNKIMIHYYINKSNKMNNYNSKSKIKRELRRIWKTCKWMKMRIGYRYKVWHSR